MFLYQFRILTLQLTTILMRIAGHTINIQNFPKGEGAPSKQSERHYGGSVGHPLRYFFYSWRLECRCIDIIVTYGV